MKKLNLKKIDRKKAIYLALAGVVFVLFIYILNPSLTGLSVAHSDFIKVENSVSCAGSRIKLQYVYLDNCYPCKEQKPIIEAIAEKYRDAVVVEYIDYNNAVSRPLVNKYAVSATPTMVFNCQYKVVGYRSMGQLEEMIASLR
ncbi:MAG: thioredoxin family protein [Candidatus Nanoarchaeia archaeon]|nr:thioredoxin family protein [Candidatus Nanoarchaeia archaeon]